MSYNSNESSSYVKCPISDYVSYKHISNSHRHFVASNSSIKEPNNFQETIKDAKWIEVMNQEIQALELNKT